MDMLNINSLNSYAADIAKNDATKAMTNKAQKAETDEELMEACKELARQIRIRNLSGIIVIDFLKMKDLRENETIVKEMSRLSQLDPTPTKVYGLTRLGLMEMTRNKEYATLKEQLTL